jgi:predicted dehydrogenase
MKDNDVVTQPLRIAAFGCGLAARQLHAPAIAALPDAELVGLQDLDLEAARRLAPSIGENVVIQKDPARLLAEVEPDVVLVLTPTASHESLAILALEAGAHVLVEKPFTESAASARRMKDAADRTGRQLSVVHNELFTPGMTELRARLARGEVGEISTVHYITSNRNQRFVPHAWYFEARGGRMGETLPHALCLLDELLPDLEVSAVRGAHLGHAILPEWAKPDPRQIDDLRVELATPDGKRLGSIWYSMNSWVPTSVLVAGSEGHLLVHPFGAVSKLRIDPPPTSESILALRERLWRGFERRLRRLRKRQPKVRIEDSSHYAELADFCGAIRSKRPVRPDAASACRVTTSWETIIDRLEAGQGCRVGGE